MLPNEFKSLGIQLHVSYSEMSSQHLSYLSEISPPMDSFMVMLNQATSLRPLIHAQRNLFFQIPMEQRHENLNHMHLQALY
jgi:hypothetical protein